MSVNINFSQLVVEGQSYDPHNHPEGLCAYDALTLSAECVNTGDHATGPFRVKFVVDGHGEQYADVHDVEPGATQWAQVHHEALAEGDHQVFVMFDAADRVHESNEWDNQYHYPFHVNAGQNVGHQLEFQPEEITGHPNLAAHGWKQIDVNWIIKDANGHPMQGFAFFTQFFGPENEESYGSQDAGGSHLRADGILNNPNVWLKPSGSVRLMGVPIQGGRYDGGPTLEGVARYTLAANATALHFDVSQGQFPVKVTASSAREASEKATAEGHAGITIDVLELGGSVGHESGSSHSEGHGTEYTVIMGNTTLTVAQAA